MFRYKDNSIHVLNNWKVVHTKAQDDGRYLACIEGAVMGTNPRFPGASIIRTSYLVAYEMHASSMVVVTARGSEYLLGKPHATEYLTQDFFKTFLSERKEAPAPNFDGTRSHVVAHVDNKVRNDAPLSSDRVDRNPVTQD